jgi:hypothetical protein
MHGIGKTGQCRHGVDLRNERLRLTAERIADAALCLKLVDLFPAFPQGDDQVLIVDFAPIGMVERIDAFSACSCHGMPAWMFRHCSTAG